MKFSFEYKTHKNMLHRKRRSVSEHMNKAWLLSIVASCSAAPEAGLVGHPWHRLRVFENRVLKRIFEPKRDEVGVTRE
jgi:hypothetical protein